MLIYNLIEAYKSYYPHFLLIFNILFLPRLVYSNQLTSQLFQLKYSFHQYVV